MTCGYIKLELKKNDTTEAINEVSMWQLHETCYLMGKGMTDNGGCKFIREELWQ